MTCMKIVTITGRSMISRCPFREGRSCCLEECALYVPADGACVFESAPRTLEGIEESMAVIASCMMSGGDAS